MIFQKKQYTYIDYIDLIRLIVFIMIFILVVFSIRAVIETNDQEGAKIIERSVRRAAVSCYAMEGRYPEDVAYLAEHYNIVLDSDRYIIHYSVAGPNLMPNITVLSKQTQ